MLPALAWSILSTSILFLLSPRIPIYQLTDFKLSAVTISPFFPSFLSFSCTIEAGLEIRNDNFLGADLHKALIDLYYPDWYDDLQHMGRLNISELDIDFWNLSPDNKNNNDTTSKNNNNNNTRLSIGPRRTIITNRNTISVENLHPRTYLNFLKNALLSKGTVIVPITGVVHATTGSSVMGLPAEVPLTVGAYCDNVLTVDVFEGGFSNGVRIAERRCTLDNVHPGWIDIESYREELRSEAKRRYKEYGSALYRNGKKEDATVDELARQLIWHEI